MSEVTCPYCSAKLPAQEVENGWCDSCGKKIPIYVLGKPALPPLTEEGPEFAEPPVRVKWGWAVAGLGALALAVLMFVMGFAAAGDEPSGSRSRRVQTVERLLGSRGTTLLCGGIFLGLGAYFFYKSVDD